MRTPAILRRVLRTLVAPLAVIAQLLVVALPLAEAVTERASGRSAGIHVEETGSRAHYAHSDAGCAACAAHHSSAAVEPGAPPALAFRQAMPAAAGTGQRSMALLASSHPPRAPPVMS